MKNLLVALVLDVLRWLTLPYEVASWLAQPQVREALVLAGIFGHQPKVVARGRFVFKLFPALRLELFISGYLKDSQ